MPLSSFPCLSLSSNERGRWRIGGRDERSREREVEEEEEEDKRKALVFVKHRKPACVSLCG